MSEREEVEKTIRILTFSGKDEAWPMWSKKFLATGKRRNYKNVLLGKDVPPPEAEVLDLSSQEGQLQKKARDANENAYNDLLLACMDDVSFGIVDCSMTDKLPDGDAAKAWAGLVAKFEPDTGSSKVELKHEFAESKLENKYDDPDEWITSLERIVQKLQRMKSSMDEEDLLIHILNNLPEAYESIIESSEKELSKGTLTLSNLKIDLRSKYKRIKKRDEEGMRTETSFIAQFKGRCHSCGKYGHKREDCSDKDSKTSNTGGGNKKKYDKSQIKCYNCQKMGHYANECKGKKVAREEKAVVAKDENIEMVMLGGDMLPTKINDNVWIADSGASCHMTNSLEGMYEIRKGNCKVMIGDGQSVETTKSGKWKGVVKQKDGSTTPIILEEVVYAPALCCKLFSINQALKKDFNITNNKKVIKLWKGKMSIVFDEIMETKLGFLGAVTLLPESNGGTTAFFGKDATMRYEKAHQLLGHSSEAKTRATSKLLGWNVTKAMTKCDSCPIAKAKQANMNKEETIKYEIGECMGSDISSVQKKSFGGGKFWLLVVDQVTKMKWSFFLKKKSEQAEVLWSFVMGLKDKQNITVKKWKCDNAGENLATQKLFDSKNAGITFMFTARETPQQNGIVERSIATLWGKTRAMLNGAKLTATYRHGSWCDAVSTATKLDVLLVDKEDEKGPFETFYREKAKYAEHLRTFGEIGIVTVSNTSKKTKLEDRGKACMFVGYAKDHTGDTYRMLNLKTKKIWISRDVIWVQQSFGDYFGLTKKTITMTEDDEDDKVIELKEPEEDERMNQPEEDEFDEEESEEETAKEGFRRT